MNVALEAHGVCVDLSVPVLKRDRIRRGRVFEYRIGCLWCRHMSGGDDAVAVKSQTVQ